MTQSLMTSLTEQEQNHFEILQRRAIASTLRMDRTWDRWDKAKDEGKDPAYPTPFLFGAATSQANALYEYALILEKALGLTALYALSKEREIAWESARKVEPHV